MSTSPYLSERDPLVVRMFPIFSRRRREVLRRVDLAIEKDLRDHGKWNNTLIPEINVPLLNIVRDYSTRTFELALDRFGGPDQPGIMDFFEACGPDEMFVRELLSYYVVMRANISPSDIRILWDTHPSVRAEISALFTSARSQHMDFMRNEDLSILTGSVRTRFEALLIILASNVRYKERYSLSMSRELSALVQDRPERAHDIIKYQRDRRLELIDVDAEAVREYLDTPSTALSDGLL